ncbi:MAG: hypothetical protein GY788_28880, partial [bacterium]|nr:hypothetical protein [bacterium]
MKRAITSGITLNLIAGIVITIVTVVAAILWMSARQNDQAARSTETMVVGGVKAIERSVESLASDYAWWDDAYSAYVGGDADWFDVNFGDSVEEAEVADLFAVISTDGVIEYSWTLSEELSVDDFLPAAAVESIASVAAELPDSLSARSASISVDRQPVIIAVSRITPFLSDPEIDPTTLPLLVVGLKLSSERLEELGKSFLIDDLRIDQSLDDVLAAGSDSTPIVDMAGTTIGYFVWTPPTPGFAVLRSIFLPVAIALVLFCVIAF